MKTYDAFLFLDELDILELRLETLNDSVDVFILLESNFTFSGESKPYNYQENISRFAQYSDKIRYLQVDLSNTFGDGDIPAMMPWDRRSYVTDQIDSALYDADPDDLVFISSINEIWNPKNKLVGLENNPVTVYLLSQYYYYLNLQRQDYKASGTKRSIYRHYPGAVNLKNSIGYNVDDGGWNFSLCRNADEVFYMVSSKNYIIIPTPEFRTREAIAKAIEEQYLIEDSSIKLSTVNIDESFPQPILEDQNKWASHIKIS
jgi:beta-1,4-mannosyl-glycoprotein beta-1,4-N-acetylglucosaminyltransferase